MAKANANSEITSLRLLVCGCRDWDDQERLEKAIFDAYVYWLQRQPYTTRHPITLICGGASGADSQAIAWAKRKGHDAEIYEPDWKKYKRAAGPLRNQRMLDEGKPDLVLAFWDGASFGTLDMIQRAVAAGLDVRIIPRKK